MCRQGAPATQPHGPINARLNIRRAVRGIANRAGTAIVCVDYSADGTDEAKC